MNKYELAKKITQLEGLTNEEKASLVELLRSQKKYGLVWEDKPEEIETRLVDELPVLTEVPERAIVSESPDAPNHILIEGDNLEALTALAYTHEGKIDVIYIDPPYNTRKKDFKYNDTFIDPEDSFSHSKWLSFISKRLKLAKTLLALNGVIFIQIDDREYAPLKLLCDELFQESNSLGPFIQNKLNAKNDTINIQKNHEYILCYRKRIQYIDEARTKILPNILIKNVRQKPVLKENGRFFYLNDSITTRGEGGTLNIAHILALKSRIWAISFYSLHPLPTSPVLPILYRLDLRCRTKPFWGLELSARCSFYSACLAENDRQRLSNVPIGDSPFLLPTLMTGANRNSNSIRRFPIHNIYIG